LPGDVEGRPNLTRSHAALVAKQLQQSLLLGSEDEFAG
jgi:hypothetical protein